MLIHVDTTRAHEQLINSRLAYVSISRARFDAQAYTNDADKLGRELSRDVSKRAALEAQHQLSRPERSQTVTAVQWPRQSHSHGQGCGTGC